MFNSIQICRGVAALLVVLFHIGGVLAKEKYFGEFAKPLENIFRFGGPAGVAFFFVLSGFIILHAHRKDIEVPGRVGRYLVKRFVRIYPTYVLIFVVVCLMAWTIPALRSSLPTDSLVLLKSVALVPQDPRVVGGTGAPVIDAAWTLQYEIMFYVAFATLILNRWLFFAVVVGFFINFCVELGAPYSFPQSFFSNELMLLFGMGMLVSLANQKLMTLKVARWMALFAFLAFILTGLFNTNNVMHLAKGPLNMIYGVLSSILLLAMLRHEQLSISAYEKKFMIMLGNSSYALYLLNFPVISLTVKMVVSLGGQGYAGVFIALIACLIACISASMFFHFCIEKPMMKKLSSLMLAPKVAHA